MKKWSFVKHLMLSMFVLLQLALWAQVPKVSLSGQVKSSDGNAMPYVNLVLKQEKDSAFTSGTISGTDGRFVLSGITPGRYQLQASFSGYQMLTQAIFVGSLTEFLDLGQLTLSPDAKIMQDVVVNSRTTSVPATIDRKVYGLNNLSAQSGGSILQALQGLPGVTVENGRVQLRGSDRVAILADGRQTALTGFDNQESLDNIPASAIERIEIINNPSAKYDANGNAGIINIIFKKSKQEGFNGKAGLSTGLGALWEKRSNFPGIRPQFRGTPKLNPSLSLNYRKGTTNLFAGGDVLYNPTLNKNEFATRTYDNGDVIEQQTKRNRRTTVTTARAGVDHSWKSINQVTISGLFSREKILDDGDEPFFNKGLSQRLRLWQFLEDEVKTTATATSTFQHKFSQPGHVFNAGVNYTFHREDERYFFTNIMPSYTGRDSFKLLSDEHVVDLTADYIKPLRYGRLETGLKYRWRYIPTNMQFQPGLNSPLDVSAGGWANYHEGIPAIYGNYIIDNQKYELEAGLRLEGVQVRYDVDPNNNVFKSDGYNYVQPFPNLRAVYKINDRQKFALFLSRRVDRPNEFDLRVFPKYDDAEIVKIGNPALRPQFTNSIELGYRTTFDNGSLYTSAYHRASQGTITRINVVAPGSNIIYALMQNAGNSSVSGLELIWQHRPSKKLTYNINLNGYRNQIDAFIVLNQYPVEQNFSTATERIFSGNLKANTFVHLNATTDIQVTVVYLAPDLIPQGKIGQRFSLDAGLKKVVQKGRGDFFVNATDLLNTMQIKRELKGNGFTLISTDYYETQVVRAGYSIKF
ncbi:Outer membrane receptor proteins, mostly Fe transport [Cnuella takakiae]|uniref:Outer membrane receptor proteins, mostly Fe transport n=1 Tax=Cnuella takakiae TaxID=1302690 RepID=A0A1M4SN63_9BACT|nr:TonB-dependent receptor [Cnuella takakiae]OLY94550.1 TonB-dependent receptor [Cnuella takakiae]SHE33618.1 Outer membrane receptor proteins, mostly Fe transport [Cnuella takakiae]